MNPILLNFITALTLQLIDQFKHRHDVITEAEIEAAALTHFNKFTDANKKLMSDALTATLKGK